MRDIKMNNLVLNDKGVDCKGLPRKWTKKYSERLPRKKPQGDSERLPRNLAQGHRERLLRKPEEHRDALPRTVAKFDAGSPGRHSKCWAQEQREGLSRKLQEHRERRPRKLTQEHRERLPTKWTQEHCERLPNPGAERRKRSVRKQAEKVVLHERKQVEKVVTHEQVKVQKVGTREKPRTATQDKSGRTADLVDQRVVSPRPVQIGRKTQRLTARGGDELAVHRTSSKQWRDRHSEQVTISTTARASHSLIPRKPGRDGEIRREPKTSSSGEDGGCETAGCGSRRLYLLNCYGSLSGTGSSHRQSRNSSGTQGWTDTDGFLGRRLQ